MSERDEDHMMDMPCVSASDVKPHVAHTAHDEEVTDLKLWHDSSIMSR